MYAFFFSSLVPLSLLSILTSTKKTYTGKENKTLDELNFYMGSYSSKVNLLFPCPPVVYYLLQTLLLETREPNEEFEEYNSAMMLFRVSKFNADSDTFGPAVNVYVNKQGTLGDLREVVETKLGVPKDKQNLYKESTYSVWQAPAVLLDRPDDTELRSFHLIEPEKIIVEYLCNVFVQRRTMTKSRYTEHPITESTYDARDDEQQENRVITALERLKNIIEIKFNLPGKDEYDQKIKVDKNITVKELKDKLQPVCTGKEKRGTSNPFSCCTGCGTSIG